MFYLVTYDVVKDKNRKKVSDLLVEYGVRVQYSVFECDLTEKDLKTIIKKAEPLIDESTDSIFFYPFCKNCSGKRVSLGTTYSLVKIKREFLDVM
ncbi:MAG: CRISPR-associated endonuclease Cas2 [Ignavibacteriales bacterium]|jgi:CRISPR-associated protein Cas2|nr:MAG: CRISPR-associated endonuclease Cas2 [Ignavibacteriaceae bacterium]MBW7873321.1 CRISPR-associated endonuclease Cas2 [Ignavibacteria bacterium]MCZ2143058.1 CRISPR-associated endonuclease Cas2 [Ignavibacteriales bacterium]OQY79591.1 MAG: CRISPR-associated endonuclease Cas2 [Ignavibacteriales bacterium UTCHB3]MBV6444748.1 CRISPR-associated endoribonuclease Cas2 [Ignavibacteriaceae bacterium]